MTRAERLAAGPTGKTRPRGVFSADERPGRATGAISMHIRPTPLLIFFCYPSPRFFLARFADSSRTSREVREVPQAVIGQRQ
jgi:hypothetical protein